MTDLLPTTPTSQDGERAAAADPLGLIETRLRLLKGLRWAALVIASAVILVPGDLLRHRHDYSGPGGLRAQAMCWAVLAAVVVREWILVLRKRPWGRERWIAAAAVLVASGVSRWALPPGDVTTSADWAFGSVGWAGVVLFLDLPLWPLATLLVVHEGHTAVVAALTSPYPRDTILNLLAGSTGTIGYPLAAGLAAATLRSIGGRVHAAAWEAEQIRIAEESARLTHEHRRERFAGVYDEAAPLLLGLAERRLDPFDERVQRACRIEAARMRRLFAETDTTDDPLLHELRQGADVAWRLGVEVSLHVAGNYPQPPVEVRRALLEPVLVVLTAAQTLARVTVLGTVDLLSVSVVSDCTGLILKFTKDPRVEVLVIDDDAVPSAEVAEDDADGENDDEDGNWTWVQTSWKVDRSLPS